MSASPNTSCGCPIIKDITVTFTGNTPAPASGYAVGYRKAGTTDSYTYLPANVINSPATIPDVRVCEDIQVVVQSQCDNSQVSTPQTTIVNAYSSLSCNTTINASHTHNGYYIYPDYLLDLRSAAGSIVLTYDVIDRPNKIIVFDDNNNEVANSGWQGVANYPFQWGTSLNTPTTGVLNFEKPVGKCFYRLVIESYTDISVQESCQIVIGCPITVTVAPTIELISCSSGFGTYRINNAPANTNLKIKLTSSGTLTNNSTTSCARIEGTILSSTGPADDEKSKPVNTTAAVDIGALNSLSINVVAPSTGDLIINTTVNTVNSLAGNTTALLTIYEVNGSAANITQNVCVGSTTGVVSCNGIFTLSNQTTTPIFIGGFTPTFFTIDTPNFSLMPLAAAAIGTGTHSGIQGTLSINVTNVGTNGCLVALKDGTPVATVNVTGAGIYTLNNLNYLNTDTMAIQFVNGCPAI